MKTPPDGALAAAQGIIADLQRQLADRTAERDEAVAQQTATAEVLQVINSSPGDLAPVFQAILQKAHAFCGVESGGLVTYDGESFRLVANHGMTEQHAENMRRPNRAAPGGPQDRLLRGERFVHVEDVRANPAGRPQSLSAIEDGQRTALFVPLRKARALLGFITSVRREVRPFTDKEIALLENFAAQAVIAIENARLITETREALEQQTATAEVLGVINSSPGNLAPVFDAMLEKAMRLCSGVTGILWTFAGDRAQLAASLGLPNEMSVLIRRRGEAGTHPILRRLMDGEHLIEIPDMAEDESYRSDELRRVAVEAGVRALLWVALVKDDTALGAFVIGRRDAHRFTGQQIALLQNFAAQAVIAMENARLITETREALDQQTATAELLGVINSSPGDLAPVFEAILEKAHTLCGADHGALVGFDGEVFRAIATRGVSSTFDEYLRGGFPRIQGSPMDGLLRGEPAHILDLPAAATESPPELARLQRQAAEMAGTRTLLMVPLCKDSILLGYIAAYRTEVRPFTDKQIALLKSFGAQAVIAMENARLLGELRQRTEEVAELNSGLEARVAEQVEELGRVGRLKRFLAPQLAELIVSQGDENILESHRREIVVVFCDLRGYTAFTETAEPEEVLDFLREYHGALGPLVAQFEGTLDQFSGDGIMVFFNDPVPIPDPAERAVKMAAAMREAAASLIADWRERGRDLGFGAGIAQGYATLGQIGFSERSGYTAIGTVCNVAARLCAEAKDGQILLSQRVNVALKGRIATEQIGALALKGLSQPVVTYNVPLAATQPALRVIEGGPPSG